MFTLSVWTGPLPLSTLTVAGIVAGAPGSPKLSYASERTTVVNLTPPESSGGGRGYHSPQRPRRAATGGLLVDENGICTRAHDDLLTVMLQTNRILATRQCAWCEAFHTGGFF